MKNYENLIGCTKRLKYCPYGSAYVRFNTDGSISLISYVTEVIRIDNQGWLTCTGTYSQTTRKHIGCFMREFCYPLSYYDAKDAYENDYQLNIYTGEILPSFNR